MRNLIFWCLISVSFESFSYSNLVIESNLSGGEESIQRIPLDPKNHELFWSFYKPTIAERVRGMKNSSETASLLCFAAPQINSATIDCEDSENSIRVQIVVNCNINNSIETAQYLFFAKVGVSNAHRNFYLYCQ